MKTLDFNAYGVSEMGMNEMTNVDGGYTVNLMIGTYCSDCKDKWTWFWEAI
ncbi:hypothetical protein FACS1894176_10250 [Bacteroidia bacterium]|nr:hypothetical protein FACS1894176_10250 [Bacteroidia bacterium]